MERLADAARRLIELVTLADEPDDADGLASRIEDVNTVLASKPMASRWTHADSLSGYLNFSPFTGRLHPMAPPLVMDRSEGFVTGRVTFNGAYEGPPGSVHGGFVAAILDELLGATQVLSGYSGYTGTLTVRFRDLTPLHTELSLRGVVDRVDGRKIHVSGHIHAGDRLTAEAEAVFISKADVSDPSRRN